MNIGAQLEKEHSKILTTAIGKYVGGDKKRFKELMDVFLKGEYRLTQRAAWPLSNIAIEHPELIKPYLGKLMVKLQEPDQHPAIARNILRIFQDIEIPQKYWGNLIDLCFKFMMSEITPVAIRAFATTVACRISVHYPELKNELMILLKELNSLPQLPAIKHRIKLALKELQKG